VLAKRRDGSYRALLDGAPLGVAGPLGLCVIRGKEILPILEEVIGVLLPDSVEAAF